MQIRWTDAALHDLTAICDYIQEHSSRETARRIALSIYERVGLLAKFPEFGRTGRRLDTTELVFSGLPYLAIYPVHDEVVEVLRILHGAHSCRHRTVQDGSQSWTVISVMPNNFPVEQHVFHLRATRDIVDKHVISA